MRILITGITGFAGVCLAESLLADGGVRLYGVSRSGRWPEYGGLRGTVPACGLYARHVDFETAEPDARPAVVLVDVERCKMSDSPEPDVR